MGGSLTKTPLERRNTVIRRSQRKSIHQLRSKIINIMKDIKKFNGINIDDNNYQQLHDRIEHVRKELQLKRKDLQPQLRNIYNETNKKLEDCLAYLNDKLMENQQKTTIQQDRNESKREDRGSVIVEEEENEEEEKEGPIPDHVGHKEAQNLEQSTNKRNTVELHVVQIESQQQQQQQEEKETKRKSIMKVGIPVLPGAIMNSLFKKSINQEEILVETRKELEKIEFEISNFVGQKNGTFYNKIKQQLDDCKKRIDFDTNDPTIKEQIKLCNNYINSCFTFLDEKAIIIDNDNNNNKSGNDGGEDVVDEVFESNRYSTGNLSPKITKTTFV